MDAIVTSKPEELPPEVRKLQDTNRVLPPDVQFFERKFSYADIAKQLVWGILLMPIGALVMVVAILIMFLKDHSRLHDNTSMFEITTLIIGFLFSGVGYLMLASLWAQYKFVRVQNSGHSTRQGIFLTPELLISQDLSDAKVIPKPFFKGVKDHKVQYQLKEEERLLFLPEAFVAHDRPRVEAAIAKWGAQA
jgi:hypothetical protein